MTSAMVMRVLLVVLVVSLVATVAVSGSQAQTTTDETFLSNIERNVNNITHFGVEWNSPNMLAQGFTTGPFADLLELKTVRLRFALLDGYHLTPGTRLSLWTATEAPNSVPRTELAVFDNPEFPTPTQFETLYIEFNLPQPHLLSAETSYYIVFETPRDNSVFLYQADPDTLDDDTLDGWTMPANLIWKPKDEDSWSNVIDNSNLQIGIFGSRTSAGVTVDPTMLTVTEGRFGTYRVALVSQPENDVTVTVASSNPSKARVNPARLTFTSTNWDEPQAVTVTGVSDPDGNNETATIDHVSSGDIYDDLPVESVEVLVVEDGSSLRDSSSFLQSSSCEGEVRLTWNTPTSKGVTVGSFEIQWRSGTEQYSTDRLVRVVPGETSYTLSSLTNGVTYTIRILALDDSTPPGPVWSRETSATPSATSCISGVSFGNILADSAPVIVELNDPEPDTMVNVRHRSLNPGNWSEIQSKPVPPGESSVVFDIRGLNPGLMYEVQAWIGDRRTPPVPNRPGPTAVAQKLFTTTALPEGVTISSSGGGGSVARIGRIEPSIRSVTLSVGDEVMLSVEVWGRQGLHDNGLADKAPADGRPAIAWSSSGSGEFFEARMRSDWRDGVANDREVRFVAPSEPGTETITASLTECLSQQEDETLSEHEARCSAQIDVTVVRRATAPIIVTAPVNPPGVIPETLTDKDGTAYAVFTPEDGGRFQGDGFSVEARPGIVPNLEFVGVSIAVEGSSAETKWTSSRYRVAGDSYVIDVVDDQRSRISDYLLEGPLEVCIPLPALLAPRISDLLMLASVSDGSLTMLSTKVRIASNGTSVCGQLSRLPAAVVVASAERVSIAPTVVAPESPATPAAPDTGGGEPPSSMIFLLMFLIGIAALLATVVMFRRKTSPNRAVGGNE